MNLLNSLHIDAGDRNYNKLYSSQPVPNSDPALQTLTVNYQTLILLQTWLWQAKYQAYTLSIIENNALINKLPQPALRRDQYK